MGKMKIYLVRYSFTSDKYGDSNVYEMRVPAIDEKHARELFPEHYTIKDIKEDPDYKIDTELLWEQLKESPIDMNVRYILHQLVIAAGLSLL